MYKEKWNFYGLGNGDWRQQELRNKTAIYEQKSWRRKEKEKLLVSLTPRLPRKEIICSRFIRNLLAEKKKEGQQNEIKYKCSYFFQVTRRIKKGCTENAKKKINSTINRILIITQKPQQSPRQPVCVLSSDFTKHSIKISLNLCLTLTICFIRAMTCLCTIISILSIFDLPYIKKDISKQDRQGEWNRER